MNEIEKALLLEVTGGAKPGLCLRTRTMVDTGRWWRRSPLWLCIIGEELVLFAAAKRRYVQKVLLTECAESSYCHAAGDLILKPVEGVEFSHVAMSPADALKVLAALKGGNLK